MNHFPRFVVRRIFRSPTAMFTKPEPRRTGKVSFAMSHDILPPLSLVIGGAASGKSAFAEKLTLSGGCPAYYFATMRRSADPETGRKIHRHELARGAGWTTREVPIELGEAVAELRRGVALVDCVTLWLANLLDAGRDLDVEGPALAQALAAAPVPVVVVTNELGGGMVPMDPGARAFRDAHGRLNQALVMRADLVALVVAGLPLALKGTLP